MDVSGIIEKINFYVTLSCMRIHVLCKSHIYQVSKKSSRYQRDEFHYYTISLEEFGSSTISHLFQKCLLWESWSLGLACLSGIFNFAISGRIKEISWHNIIWVLTESFRISLFHWAWSFPNLTKEPHMDTAAQRINLAMTFAHNHEGSKDNKHSESDIPYQHPTAGASANWVLHEDGVIRIKAVFKMLWHWSHANLQ